LLPAADQLTLFFPAEGDTATSVFFWFGLIGLSNIFYAYFGYPLLISALVRLGFKRHAVPRTDNFNVIHNYKVTLIISAFNEESVIAEKIRNTLALRFGESSLPHPNVEIIVASDASSDRTDEIVRSFVDKGVRLVRLDTRGGKETAQKAAVEQSSGDIIIFSDSKVMLDEQLINGFLGYFADPVVGAVSSVDRVISSEQGSGEGFYVRYEMWLRELESEFNGLIGLSGSCFAVRRQIALKIRTDIPSDFALIVATRQTFTSDRRPMIGVHGEGVYAYYREVSGEKKEFERKVRTVLRGMTALWKNRHSLNPFLFGIFAWQMFSHKLSRWLVPLCLAITLLCSLAIARRVILFKVVAAAQILFYVLALIGYLLPRTQRSLLVKIPLFFTVVNLGIAVAGLKFITGTSITTWNPSQKGFSSGRGA
jgi:glycosyltransferase involved in cell wall biosynthesis